MQKYLYKPLNIAPLVVFRALFGFIMLVSIVRFWAKGWIEVQYIEPEFFFSYYGFEWVKAPGPMGMYALFMLMALSALGIMLGFKYRWASVLFFLSFSYVELIDKSNYLNHYYFVSIVSLLLVFVPAHRAFSLDAWLHPSIRRSAVPAWTINIFKFQLGIVYVYAGIAKLNKAWLLEAMPLRIWLPAKSHLPIIGTLLQYKATAYFFSWFGAIYDLFVVFFLLNPRTRLLAYGAVLAFHFSTAALFQIGMFPYIMVLATLIYFPASFHQRLIDGFYWFIGSPHLSSEPPKQKGEELIGERGFNKLIPLKLQRQMGLTLLIAFCTFQLLFPWRYLLYPGNVFWTEEGYRFSWRVMLMEKAGYTVFHIYDLVTDRQEQALNYEYLNPNQEKMMSTQPDMILQFAHYLAEEYKAKGFEKPYITAESYVTLNGRRSKSLIDPTVNLVDQKEGWHHKDWILPWED